jgi:Flp pilus assembly protein TadG
MMRNRSSTIRSQKSFSRRRGAAAVEFAIAISVLLLIMFASIEFARLNMIKHSVEHASYLAARRGIITGAKVNDVKAAAEFHLGVIGLTGESITVSPNKINDQTTVIEVTIDVPMAGNTWISPAYFGGTMSATTRMFAERAAADMAGAVGAGSGD